MRQNGFKRDQNGFQFKVIIALINTHCIHIYSVCQVEPVV